MITRSATAATLGSSSPMAMVAEFHRAFEVKPFIEQPDAYGRHALIKTRMNLVAEEYAEVMDELLDFRNGSGDFMKLAKELADLLYVVYGTAESLSIPLEKVFAAVHESNMSKLGGDGKPLFREDGKVLKGPNYHEPDFSKIFGVSD